MKRFFTADQHYNSSGIIEYENRPFKSPSHMNQRLIGGHNGRVKDDDTVYHVGDFLCYGTEKGRLGLRVKPSEIFSQLNGRNIRLLGDHDSNNGVKSDCGYLFMNIGKYRAFVTHRPIDCRENTVLGRSFWANIVEFAKHNTELCICGHWHQRKNRVIDYGFKKYAVINVGVDNCRYIPVSEQEIIQEVGRLLA